MSLEEQQHLVRQIEEKYNCNVQYRVEEDQITEVDLSSQNLTDFPIELTQIRSLKILVMQENDIRTLPAEITNLDDLEILALSYNQLEDQLSLSRNQPF